MQLKGQMLFIYRPIRRNLYRALYFASLHFIILDGLMNLTRC